MAHHPSFITRHSSFVISLLPVLALSLVCGCSSSDDASMVNYLVDNDSISCQISAPVPESSLKQPFGEWLDELLGGYYTGDAGDLEALVEFYGNAYADTLRARFDDIPGTPKEYEATVEKAYETDDFVTYTLSTYFGIGGAHPTSGEYGVTFRKSDGRRITWDIIRNDQLVAFNDLLREELEGYFDVKNSSQLEKLLATDRVFDLPLPKTPPYFTEDGVAFVYQQYEIAAYAFGMPGNTIPYDRIEPLLTEWAKKILPK